MTNKPHGILVATAAPFREGDLSLDLDRYAEHCSWLVAEGAHGVVPNGSLGEYQLLSAEERAATVHTAIKAVGPDGFVVPGVGAYGADESKRWTEQAAEAGAHAVMALPSNAYRSDRRETVRHFEVIASVGLPVIIYNNPQDTKVDLTPDLVAEIAQIDGVIGIKEFSTDVRRVTDIINAAPNVDIFAGADDLIFESLIMGAKSWIAGYPNVFPKACRKMYDLALEGRIAEVLPFYREVRPAFSWDTRSEFIQAIKLGMDMVGRYGGPTRLPRLPLPADKEAVVRKETERAIAAAEAFVA
jgi:4-hydroxy-tetrahydrodipicolinate synthase